MKNPLINRQGIFIANLITNFSCKNAYLICIFANSLCVNANSNHEKIPIYRQSVTRTAVYRDLVFSGGEGN